MPKTSLESPLLEQADRPNDSIQEMKNTYYDPYLPSNHNNEQVPSTPHTSSIQLNYWGDRISKSPGPIQANEDVDSNTPSRYLFQVPSRVRRASTLVSTWSHWTNIIRIRHPLSERFETPLCSLFVLHAFLCLMTYPALLISAIAATGRTLFWARVVVGMGCSIMGLGLGFTLLGLTQALVEAATWATLIDQSAASSNKGIRLRDFAIQADDPKGLSGALTLLWWRWKGRKTTKPYSDHRFWTGYILLFVFTTTLSAALSFIFGRTLDIVTYPERQYDVYDEVAVGADLSVTDLLKAADLAPVFLNHRLFTWTIESFAVHGNLPPPVSFPYDGDVVHFAEITQQQLLPGGTGFGTFDWDEKKLKKTQVSEAVPHNKTTDMDDPIDPGAVLVFPRWGLRTHCERIHNLRDNMIIFSKNGITYLFTPREIVRSLFRSFNLMAPPMVDEPLNVSGAMYADDTIPPTMNISSWMLGVPYWSNGVSNNVKSKDVSLGDDGHGFATIENVLIRLNNSYAPKSKFPFRDKDTILDAKGKPTFIGFDAAVCLQLYEPWILDVYNSSTGPPTTMRIRRKVNTENWSGTLSELVLNSKLVGEPIKDPMVKRYLNSSGYSPAFIAAHENSVNQVAKDNGRDSFYVHHHPDKYQSMSILNYLPNYSLAPTPQLVSFTNGSGPFGYTEFSPELYAAARSFADASNVLPYLSGSGQLVARRYSNKMVAITSVRTTDLTLSLSLIFITGLLCTICVPKLPMGVPKRGFNLYSWILAFHAKEIELDGGDQIGRGMHLDELEEYAGNTVLRFRVFEREEA